MNRLEAMNIFVRVAELGSFSAAASQLGVARSVVTRQVAALEEHLGVKLMIRSTRSLSLTSAGSGYLEKCRAILDLVAEAETEVMEERMTPSGPLRISLPLSFGLRRLVPLLLEFTRTYPAITLAMDFSDRQANLIEEGIDLSIRVTADLAPNEIVRKLGSSRLLTVAAPEYLQEHGRPQHPAELAEHACLGYSPQANNRPWVYQSDGRPTPFYVSHRLQANNGDALTEAAVHGLGIAVQPDFIVGDLIRAGKLEVILEPFEPLPLGIYAVLPSNRHIPYRVRALIDFISGRLAP
jgi:DNA-binding transcriptional LysR family regulator